MTLSASAPEQGLITDLPATLAGLWTAITMTHDIADALHRHSRSWRLRGPRCRRRRLRGGSGQPRRLAARGALPGRRPAGAEESSMRSRALPLVSALASGCIDLAIDLLGNEAEPLSPVEVLARHPSGHRPLRRPQPRPGMCTHEHRPRPRPALAPVRRSTTTYAQLTEQAARCIARATLSVSMDATGGRRPTASDVAAHQDLAAALVHLGETLARPLASRPERPGRRRGGPDARLLRSLETVARARDWSEPSPADGPGADLAEAAFLIRSAADLWATHHCADGRPRSPEASRMRHPSTLGAASRNGARWSP